MYSYGVIMLEVLSGRGPRERPQRAAIRTSLTKLGHPYDHLVRVITALDDDQPEQRPTARRVVESLTAIVPWAEAEERRDTRARRNVQISVAEAIEQASEAVTQAHHTMTAHATAAQVALEEAKQKWEHERNHMMAELRVLRSLQHQHHQHHQSPHTSNTNHISPSSSSDVTLAMQGLHERIAEVFIYLLLLV
jgi:hypothetical protein